MTRTTANGRSQRMQPLAAARALQELIRNPEDTAKVFEIIRAMSGSSLEQGFERFIRLPLGRKVIEEQRSLLAVLSDRDALRAMAPDSLGRAYLRFVESENLTADGLVAASDNDEVQDNAWLARFGERLRDQHDLWHTLTGYGRDELGELCLLAFTYAQNRNRGIGLIVLIGALKMSKHLGPGVFRAALRGYRDGRRAAWLPGEDWEALLEEPLDGLRRRLEIAEPVPYEALRASYAA